MMPLGIALDELSSAHWERAFRAYVTVNRSHWTGPPFEFVQRLLRERGWYEFGVPGLGTWTSRFRLEVVDGQVLTGLVINPALGERMKERLSRMDAEFQKLLR